MRAALLTLLIVTAACATGAGRDGPRRDPNRITRAEIEASTYTNAYEIVRGLRARWLQPTASMSIRSGPGIVRTYLDGSPAGELQSVPRAVIREIRFYPPAEAQARWGLSHQRGAIDIITRGDAGG